MIVAQEQAEPVYTAPREYNVLERVTLRHEQEEVPGPYGSQWKPRRLVLEVELRTNWPHEPRRLLVTFSEVSGLKLLSDWWVCAQIYLLQVFLDYHQRGPKYWVIDPEEEGLSFWCEDYSVTETTL